MARAGGNGLAGALLCGATLAAGCATIRPASVVRPPHFPLPACVVVGQRECAVRLFRDDRAVAERLPDGFPRHYLELWDEAMRRADCVTMTAGTAGEANRSRHGDASLDECLRRLTALNDYFNPDGRPAADRVAVALEGGGSKSSPFALGVLAGLQEMGWLEAHDGLGPKVAVISSVSGGSYAASFLYNRLYDRAQQGDAAGDYARWFASCIPDPFAVAGMFDRVRDYMGEVSCGEGIADSPEKHFKDAYAYQAQVWLHPNVVMGDLPGGPKNPKEGSVPWAGLGNTALLLGETMLLMPYQAVARTIFRWPDNSSPTRYTYKNGLERQFGYSPKDWEAVDRGYPGPLFSDLTHAADTEFQRRRTRTLSALAQKLAMRSAARDEGSGAPAAPLWIIGSSTPGAIIPDAWLLPATRDPLRHQFELTPYGYGSGIHGYANVTPQPGSDGLLGTTPYGLPIVDAVVASAGFFDDDQTEISSQPWRVLGNFAQHVTDITWYTEIPNFNAGQGVRVAEWLLPYPAYLTLSSRQSMAPYIHLQDGGNSENSGIFPVLRRGYRQILFAQSGEDTEAQFGDICHLKNQLELDSEYFIASPDLEAAIASFQAGTAPKGSGTFASYLDQICSQQLDQSDLASYDENEHRPVVADRSPTVAKLLCGRLGDLNALGDRTVRDPGYRRCEAFRKFFYVEGTDGIAHVRASINPLLLPPTFKNINDFYHRWSGAHLNFQVYKGDALRYRGRKPPPDALLSTIVVVLPAVSWQDFQRQVSPDPANNGPREPIREVSSVNDHDEHPWARFCAQSESNRQRLRIEACRGPGNVVIGPDAFADNTRLAVPALSCTSMAYLVATGCKGKAQPDFPQDNFIAETWNTTYTMFSAYFDLGRNQVWRTSEELHVWPFDGSSQELGESGVNRRRSAAPGANDLTPQ